MKTYEDVVFDVIAACEDSHGFVVSSDVRNTLLSLRDFVVGFLDKNISSNYFTDMFSILSFILQEILRDDNEEFHPERYTPGVLSLALDRDLQDVFIPRAMNTLYKYASDIRAIYAKGMPFSDEDKVRADNLYIHILSLEGDISRLGGYYVPTAFYQSYYVMCKSVAKEYLDYIRGVE